jgi:hypothetical protein
MSLSESWEDFEVPELTIPAVPIVPIVNNVPKKIYDDNDNDTVVVGPMSKILSESEIREKEMYEKELEIAFKRAKQTFIDYQIKKVYPTYNRMNKMGKQKTLEKILNEIKGYKSAAAILQKLEIQKCVDTGRLLSVDIA